jgi:hypothetical protein
MLDYGSRGNSERIPIRLRKRHHARCRARKAKVHTSAQTIPPFDPRHPRSQNHRSVPICGVLNPSQVNSRRQPQPLFPYGLKNLSSNILDFQVVFVFFYDLAFGAEKHVHSHPYC